MFSHSGLYTMRRTLFAVLMFAAVGLTACTKEITGPSDPMDAQAGIYLPPFQQKTIEVMAGAPSYVSFGSQTLVFEAPVGVFPILDVTASSPSIVTGEAHLWERDCDRTCVWIADVSVFVGQNAQIGGRSTITVRLRANQQVSRSFEAIVTSSYYPAGCTSFAGYSTTTGYPCGPTLPQP